MNRRKFVAQLGLGAAALGLSGRSRAVESGEPSKTPSGVEGQLLPALATGWNTWSTQSVFTHVLLPEALALKLSFCHFGMMVLLRDGFFGSKELGATAGVHLSGATIKPKEVRVQAGRHAYNGAYTALTIVLGEANLTVESAHDGPRGLVLWITCTGAQYKPPALIVEPALLWNHPGHVEAVGPRRWRVFGTLKRSEPARPELALHLLGDEVFIYATVDAGNEPNLTTVSPAWVFPLSGSVGLSVGQARSAAEIQGIIAAARAAEARSHERYGSSADVQAAIQSGLAWNTIYEPSFQRLLNTSSRAWNVARLGYGIFCWDGFFYGWMVGADNPALARTCVLEVFRGMIDGKFVPNVLNGSGRRSADRSQPCVGGMAILAMYEMAPDRAFLEQAWPSLLRWNRWWHEERRNSAGLLSWGSDPTPIEVGDLAETLQPNCLRGGSLESGMDNTPMYDGMPFDEQRTHLMGLSDVGLVCLYITDCQSLSVLAAARGDTAAKAELDARAADYSAKVLSLWDERAGIFANRRTDTGEFSSRLSPTCFYPMLAGVATPAQAQKMIDGYLLNPQKFGGEWGLPSVPRDDPSFSEQVYWRGRVWAPLNFFVYLGLRRSGHHRVATDLAERSRKLFEVNWRKTGAIYENFSPLDGQGGGVLYSDPLCPWSGLLVFMDLMEKNLVPLPSILRGPNSAV